MSRLAKGFTLIELMIVVAIIGILASVAITSYSQYTIRARVSELLVAASAYKISIAEKWQQDNTLGSAGAALTVTTTGRISGGSVTNAGIINVQGSSATIGTAVNIVLTPVASTVTIGWLCSTGSGNASMWAYVPAECRH